MSNQEKSRIGYVRLDPEQAPLDDQLDDSPLVLDSVSDVLVILEDVANALEDVIKALLRFRDSPACLRL